VAIINEHGLFQGKRLRRCSTKARLLWPYLYVASNGFARSELDYDFIADQFASFRADAPTPEELAQYFAEFQANHLIFTYQYNGQSWGQWDTPRSHTKEYKTAIDKASPTPPEAPYIAWLKEQHGADWSQFHWSKDAIADPPETFAQNSAEILLNVDRNSGLGVGVGVGVGVGSGKNPSSEVSPSDAELIANAPKENSKEASPSANRLASLLAAEIHRNKADYRITPAQQRNWGKVADLMMRRDGRTEEQIADLIRWVQRDEFWHKNILSMDKLREKFDQLEMKRAGETPHRSTNVDPEITPSQRLEMRKAASAEGVQ
jgi:hypothetical protein